MTNYSGTLATTNCSVVKATTTCSVMPAMIASTVARVEIRSTAVQATTYSSPVVGEDMIDGGSGLDLIDLGAATGGAKVDLSKNAVAADGIGIVSVKSVEGVVGTDFADVISASKYDNVISGGDGDDWIRGKEGADILTGGDGADTFFWHRKDVVDADGDHLGVDTIKDFDAVADTLDFTGLIKATKFDNISEVVVLEESEVGTIVSVYAGAAAGVQQVTVLDDVFDLDVETLYDSGAILA